MCPEEEAVMPGYRPSHRVVLLVFLVTSLVAAAADGQTKWTQGRTPDGQPDIQGIWINFDSTPFEAPVAQPAAPAPAAAPAAAANVGPASEFADHTHKVSARRRSMVIDPPDGRVPVMKWAEDKRDYDLAHIPDAPGARDAVGALHHARLSGGVLSRRLQQRLRDHSDSRLRGDRVRDDPRDADHPDRRTPAPR